MYGEQRISIFRNFASFYGINLVQTSDYQLVKEKEVFINETIKDSEKYYESLK